jgi:flagellar assembly protein FliH
VALIRAARLSHDPVTLRQPVHAPAPGVAPLAPARPSAEERERELIARLESIERDAREAGLREGREQGQREGREQGLREGREEGAREGREAATAKVEAELGAQVAALAAFLKQARTQLDRQIDGLEPLCAEIAFESAAKILGRAMLEPDGVAAAVREAIRRARDRSRLVLRVSPRDFALLEAQRGRLADGLDSGPLELVADGRVELGGCLLETPGGTLDARLEVQLAALRDALLGAHAPTGGDPA